MRAGGMRLCCAKKEWGVVSLGVMGYVGVIVWIRTSEWRSIKVRKGSCWEFLTFWTEVHLSFVARCASTRFGHLLIEFFRQERGVAVRFTSGRRFGNCFLDHKFRIQ